jgi:hypothetical protein
MRPDNYNWLLALLEPDRGAGANGLTDWFLE